MSEKQNIAAQRHIVLVEPEIHWNTGNIGRTCLAAGAALHLVRPLGFSLESREVRRAGLDYWEAVCPFVWDSFDDFLRGASPGPGEVAIFSKRGRLSLWSLPYKQRLFLVFGSETRGLPQHISQRYQDAAYFIPMTQAVRSLNLSTAAGIALYESIRGHGPAHAWPPQTG